MSWPLVKLDDVATLLRGVTFSSDDSVGQPCENYLPVLRAGNIQEKLYMEEGLIWIPEDKIKENQKIKENDIVMCTSSGSADLVGKCAKSLSNWNGSFGAFCAGIRANPKKVDASYLYHFLCSPMFRTWTKKSSGANIKNIRISELGEFKLPLPPLEEQKRIAAILDKADAIRRKRQQAIKLADDFLRSVFLEMFGDPVTNPKGWEVKKLGEVAELINGDRSSNYPSGDDLKESGILFLNTKNITDDRIELVDPVFITEEKFNSLSRGKLQREDLVITLRGTLGSCAIFSTTYATGFINAQLMIIRPKVGITSDFLHSYLTSDQIQDVLQSLGRGAAVPQLTGAQMKDLNVYIPNVELLDKFTKIKNTVSNLKFKCNVAEKAELFESLSQKAFSGMI